MTILTSAGTTHEVEWIESPTQDTGALSLSLYDTRRLPAIAAEFDGLQSIQRYDEQQGDKLYTGYTALTAIKRMPDGTALLTMRREEA